MLLRGNELDKAMKDAETESKTVTKDERDFLAACLRVREREQREKRGNLWIRILAIGATIALIATIYFAYQTKRAQESAEESSASEASVKATATVEALASGSQIQALKEKALVETLAKEARDALGQDDTRKLGQLLAVEAFNRNSDDREILAEGADILPIVFQALFDSASRGNDLRLGAPFSSAAFSPDVDGKWLVVDNTLLNLQDVQSSPLTNTGEILQSTIRSDGEVVSIVQNSGSSSIGQSPYTVYIQNTSSQVKEQIPLNVPDSAYAATDINLSEDGHWVSMAYGLKPNSISPNAIRAGGVQLLNIQSPSPELRRVSVQSLRALGVDTAQDGAKMAVVDDAAHLYLWKGDKNDTFLISGTDYSLSIDFTLSDEFIHGVFLGKSGKGLQFSPDGQWLAVLTKSGFQIFDTNANLKSKTQIPIPAGEITTGFLFSPDSKYLIYVTNDYSDCFDFYYNYLDSYEYLSYYQYYEVSDDYGCNPSTSVSRWSLVDPNQKPQKIFENKTTEITAMNISNDGRLVIGDEAGYIRYGNLSEDLSDPKHVTNVHNGKVVNILVGPDNKAIVSAGEKDGTKLWKITDNESDAIIVHRTFNATTNVIRSESNGEDVLIIGGTDSQTGKGAVDIFPDLQNPVPLKESLFNSKEDGNLRTIAISEQWIAAGRKYQKYYSGDSYFLDIWNRQSTDANAPPVSVQLPSEVSSLAFSSDGTRLAMATTKGNLLWVTITDLTTTVTATPTSEASTSGTPSPTPPQMKQLNSNPMDIQNLVFVQNDKYLIGAGTTGVHIWDMSGSEEIELPNAVYPIEISANQKWLATDGTDGTIHLYNLEDIFSSPTIIPKSAAVTRLSFSDDEAWLAVAINTGKVLVYELGTISTYPVKATYTFQGAPSDMTWLEFSPSQAKGKWLVASGRYDYAAYLWNMENSQGDPVILQGHTGTIVYAGFTKDGKQIITAATDETLRFWSMDPERLRDTTCTYAERNLFPEEWKHYQIPGELQETCKGFDYGLEQEQLIAMTDFTPTPYPTAALYYHPTNTPIPTPTPVGDTILYTVKDNDTLGGIALMFYGTFDTSTLVADNNIANVNIIVPGQVLKIRVTSTPPPP
jgi:hypothetical protein